MGIGYAPEEDPPLPEEGGLANFDVDAASQNLANVGQGVGVPEGDPPIAEPTPVPGLAGFDVDKAAANLAAVGQPVPREPDVQAPPPAEVPNTGQADQNPKLPGAGDELAPLGVTQSLGPIPAPPQPPALTGDPQKDTAANVAYGRALTAYHGQLSAHAAALGEKVSGVEAQRAQREAEAEKRAQEQRDREIAQYQQERQQRQQQIDAAVAERASAAHALAAPDHRGWSWRDAIAIALGGMGAARQAVSNVQSGHGGEPVENVAVTAINKRVEAEREQKKARLASASEGLLEARYGYKDAADNHRAALNDLDADTAAKYRMIAKEAEAQLRSMGSDDAAIKNNAVIADALAKQTAAETAIHQREEGMGDSRAHSAAMENIARATLGEHRAEFRSKEEDRKAAKAEKKAAKAEKDDAENVNSEKGVPYARVPTGRGGSQGFQTRDADYGRAINQLEGLLKDVKDNGNRALSPEAVKRRTTRYKNAVIGVATVSPLGKTNESMNAEAESIGSSGAIDIKHPGAVVAGANPEAIQRKIDEIKEQRDRYRKETLRPLRGKTTIEYPTPGTETTQRPAVMKLGGIEYHLQPDGTYK